MKSRTSILFTLLSVVLVMLFVADIAIGSVSISLTDIFGVLTGSNRDSTIRSIVIDIRLIKALMALLAGAALSLSGLQMQTLFRNPLAGPYILGVSAGASFGWHSFFSVRHCWDCQPRQYYLP